MLANKFNHIISPADFLPSVNFPPPCKIQLRRSHIAPHATSISIPDIQIRPREVEEDEAVAFWDYQFLFTSQRLEVSHPIKLKLIDGTFPIDLPSGTYYLVGPGLFIDDYGSTIHPLDGHGYVRAFEINGPKKEVKFSAKYVKTEAQKEECDPISGSWKFTHRGPFSVLKGGKKIANTKVMKNVANTSVLKWGGRLLCLWEGGTPYEIHPQTLDTIGSFNMMVNCVEKFGDFDDDQSRNEKSCAWDVVANLVKPILYGVFKMPPKRLLSHYKIDHVRKRLLIMTCNAEDMILPRSHFTFYEFDVHFNLIQKQEFEMEEHLMIHDWAFTDTHYILFGNRVKLDILGSVAAISGLAPMITALSVNQSNPTSPIYILPRFSPHKHDSNPRLNNDCDRDRGKCRWKNSIEVPQSWLLHVANAYQDVDSHGNLFFKIHATTCASQWFNFHKLFGYNWQQDMLDPSTMNCKGEREPILPHLVEVSIKLDTNGNQQECSIKRLSDQVNISSDFPIINPRHSGYKHRYVYAAASSGSRETLPHFPFDMITKMDTENRTMHTWSPGDRRFVGEPMFVSRGVEEDDGYLLVIEYVVSHRRCNFLILDPRKIGEANAVVARYEVPRSLTFPLGFHGTWTPKQLTDELSTN